MIKIACYHPLIGFREFNPKTGKEEVKVISKEERRNLKNTIEIPCGKCIGCRLNYATKWALRCQLEAKQYTCNYFLTLTYDDGHLPIRSHHVIDKETGEVIKEEQVATLVPEHFTKFVKDLRRYFEYHYQHDGIKVFGAGEYGGKTLRPHYHMILFNLPIPDLKLHKESYSGNTLFVSDIIHKIWGKGWVYIGGVTFESCAYVARYCMKKQGSSKTEAEERGVEKEFIRMSRNPGIGYKYLLENKEKIKKYDNIVLRRGDKVLSFKPPKYFEKFMTDEEIYEVKKHRRRLAELGQSNAMKNTSLDREQELKREEEAKIRQASSLKRNIE